MHPVTRFLRFFFHHLYHGFAWAYDLVSGGVSFGRWNDWTSAVLPFVVGKRVLELGHGPGHLQERLRHDLSLLTVGLDESPQMGGLAAARLRRNGIADLRLVRGLAQDLPFPADSFDTVVSTFPSEYIFDARTLAEVRRTLVLRGRLIVLPVAWPKNRLLAWLFRVTGESPSEALELASAKLKRPFIEARFEVDIRRLEVRSVTLLVVLSTKLTR
jgi:ubiquinone/menaquinone biosynthesis C-methylase UbiE